MKNQKSRDARNTERLIRKLGRKIQNGTANELDKYFLEKVAVILLKRA